MERLPVSAGMAGVPTLFGVVAGTGLLAAIAARARTEHRTDPKAERRLRFWSGPLGGWLFTLAGVQLKRRATPRPRVLSPDPTPPSGPPCPTRGRGASPPQSATPSVPGPPATAS